jgi:hypothetical protein
MPEPIIGQKFSLGKTKVAIDNFPAPRTSRFDVRVNGLLAGSIIALVTKDDKGAVLDITGFYVAGHRQATFLTARHAATALAQSVSR